MIPLVSPTTKKTNPRPKPKPAKVVRRAFLMPDYLHSTAIRTRDGPCFKLVDQLHSPLDHGTGQ